MNATLIRFCERRIRGIAVTMGELQMGNTDPAENVLVDEVLGGVNMIKMMTAFNDSPHEWSEISAQVRQNFALLEDLNAERARDLATTRKELRSIVGR